MDKNSLKIFAIEARQTLIENMKRRLENFGITEQGKKELNILGKNIEANERIYSKGSYDNLVLKYEKLGFEQLVEEGAYTWFNRLIALAYMEINGYIDEKMIFSSNNKIEPDIMDNYYEVEFFTKLDREKQEEIHNLKDKNNYESTEVMYSILIEEKCRELSSLMPFMFNKKNDYSDILFPLGLLSPNSLLIRLREEFEKAKGLDEDGEEKVPVEIIGWLYQYYNQTKREIVYDGTLKKSKISKYFIAPATQLFTPDWIVKYMTENSLGKLALENLGVSENLKNEWKYYIDSEKDENEEKLKIEDIKIIDPAMGSGHMLTYCFDMLFKIYEDLGWSKKDIVFSILKNNLYGLEIDKRAGQLASFAIFMKAREKFSRFFRVYERLNKEEKFQLNTSWIDESNDISEDTRKIIYGNSLTNLETLLRNFDDAKEYGSILKLEEIKIEKLYEELESLKILRENIGQLSIGVTAKVSKDFEDECALIEKLIIQQKIMSEKYDIVITNPPYMGNGRMNDKLKKYIEKYYSDVKSDLFSTFFIKCLEMSKIKGHLGFMSPFVWMFIKSYEELRRIFIEEKTITSLIQLEYSGFEDATVPICTFTLQNNNSNKKGDYIRLSDFKGAKNQPIKTLEAIKNPNCGWRYKVSQKEFEKIPGSPIAYWVSDKIRETFEKNKKLGELGEAKQGLATADNDRFLRLWNEVNYNKIGFGMKNSEEALESRKKWFPYNKGGEKRKWYGNQEYLVNWENNGYEIKNFYDKNGKLRSRPQNTEYYFKNSISWTDITSSGNSFRIYPQGFIYDVTGMSYFIEENKKINLLGILNNKFISIITKILNPTLHLQIGDLIKIPYFEVTNLKNIVQQNISIAKEEWDSRETSWDFEKSYLAKGNSIELAYNDYCNHWRDNFVQMHKNEEELNEIFINIYELQKEMDSYVPFEDITLLKKEATIEEIMIPPHNVDDVILDSNERIKTSEDYLYYSGVRLNFNKLELVKQFLSYGVGCIMGRYSLDKNGLIMANSDDVLEKKSNEYFIKDKNGEIRYHIENPKYYPKDYGIIPITSEKVFEDDIVTEIIKFVKTVYGEENLEENLKFICEALGKKESESYEDTLRNYFIKDFYNDHLQRYQKRPIYWLMNSGKKNGFSALIYLHRYEENTIARVRTEYLLPYQEKMEKLRNYYENEISNVNITSKEKKNKEKEIKEIDGVLKELKDYANEVKHISEMKISLDLDDGVKVNYEKFGKVLKKI